MQREKGFLQWHFWWSRVVPGHVNLHFYLQYKCIELCQVMPKKDYIQSLVNMCMTASKCVAVGWASSSFRDKW